MADADSGSQSAGRKFTPKAGGKLSLREFARQIGVSDTAVRKAIKVGRLAHSLDKDANGAPIVVDFERARAEWASSSRTGAGVRTSPPSGSQHGSQQPPPTTAPVAPRVSTPVERHSNDGEVEAPTLFDAQRIATLELARKRRLENEVAEGHLVPIDDVRKEAFEAERIVRESIMNLPARIAGELAAEGDAGRVHLRLEAALREALGIASDSLLAAANA